MGVLDSILSAKPLKPWQEKVKEEGRLCGKCSAPLSITASVNDDADMLRLRCESCQETSYEFPPHKATIIKFEDLRSE